MATRDLQRLTIIQKFQGGYWGMRISGLDDDLATPLTPSITNLQTFVVIDLLSQGRAVYQYTRDWHKDEVLTWLRLWGTLYSWQRPGFPETYEFRSWCGLLARFFVMDDRLTFLSDHTTTVPPASICSSAEFPDDL